MSGRHGGTSGSTGTPCPKCKHQGSSVSDSRPNNESVRRRRTCHACGYRYTTYEFSDEALQEWAERQKYGIGGLSGQARIAVKRIVDLLRAGESKENAGHADHR